MDLDWLKDFLALAEAGNFSRAADARNVTQPAFSRRVRALEAWIGAALFVRTAQGATLTAAGETFREAAIELARSLEMARLAARSSAERERSSLAVAATHVLSFNFFPAWIHRLLDLDTLGNLSLASDTSTACEQMMLSGVVHFILCHHHSAMQMRLDTEHFPSCVIGRDTLLPVSAAGSDGRPMWPLPGMATNRTRLLGYSDVSGLGRILSSHAGKFRDASHVDVVFTSHLAATLLAMARDGRGAAWLPLTLIEDDLRSGRLVRAGATDFDIPLEIKLFRSLECRNAASDRLWAKLAQAE